MVGGSHSLEVRGIFWGLGYLVIYKGKTEMIEVRKSLNRAIGNCAYWKLFTR